MKVKLTPSGEQHHQRGLGTCPECRLRQRLRQRVADNRDNANKSPCDESEDDLHAKYEDAVSKRAHTSECEPDIRLMNALCREEPLPAKIRACHQKILTHVEQEQLTASDLMSHENFKMFTSENQGSRATTAYYHEKARRAPWEAHQINRMSQSAADMNWSVYHAKPLRTLCRSIVVADNRLQSRLGAVHSVQIKAKSLLQTHLTETLKTNWNDYADYETPAGSEYLVKEVAKLCADVSGCLSHDIHLSNFENGKKHAHHELDLWVYAASNAARMSYLRDVYTALTESKAKELDQPELAAYLVDFFRGELRYPGPELNYQSERFFSSEKS